MKHLISVRDALHQQADELKATVSQQEQRIGLYKSESLVLTNESNHLRAALKRIEDENLKLRLELSDLRHQLSLFQRQDMIRPVARTESG